MQVNFYYKKQLLVLFITAFILRGTVFYFFIQPGEYYKQPDSFDYHNCALSITYGSGMHRPDTGEPLFWRTPGYPLFLSWFYSYTGLRGVDFTSNSAAQHAAIWIQIFLSSFIPLIIFLLAYLITRTYPIAWASAWVSVFHIGFVLASTYILTEGIALIFFYLFLLCVYQLIFSPPKRYVSLFYLFGAILMLSIYTWMRPMGECVAIVTAIILLFLTYGSWKKKCMYTFLFVTVFFASLSPWYIRNYQLTGEWFFCPTIGIYLNCFCVPKILRRVLNKPIEQCHQLAQHAAAIQMHKKKEALRGSGKYPSPLLCKNVSVPIVQEYPWYFINDWIKEVLKTTFDLYANQLVAMANKTFWYDPIEEFLSEKVAACLYKQPMPLFMRLACWSEFLWTIVLWIGLGAGFVVFIIRPLFRRIYRTPFVIRMQYFLLSIVLLSGAVICTTGGFGYARLRLPIEPLMIILSLAFWYWLLVQRKNNEKTIRAVA